MKLLLTLAVIVLGLVVWQRTRESQQKRRRLFDYPAPGQGTDEDVKRFLSSGRKMTAIKLYREIHGVDLKQAKEAVERLASDPMQQKESQ